MKPLRHLPYFFWGLSFGFIISRAGATRFDFIQDMFLLRSPQLYYVIGGAIAVALPLFAWLKSKDPRGLPWPQRHWTPGTLPGAAIFGLGWAMTGTCPGPAAIQVGEGHLIAVATVLGIFAGNLIYEKVHRRWFHWRPDSCT